MLAIAAIAVLMATGCGSDSGDDTASQANAGGASEAKTEGGSEGQSQSQGEGETETQSGEETQSAEGGTSSGDSAFVKEANDVCRQARQGSFEKLEKYRAAHKSDGLSPNELTNKAINAVLLETIEEEIAGLEALAPQAEDPGQIEGIVAEMEATLGEAQAKANNEAGFAEIEALFAGEDKTLESLGLSECSKSA
jgi:hypothetical protein